MDKGMYQAFAPAYTMDGAGRVASLLTVRSVAEGWHLLLFSSHQVLC